MNFADAEATLAERGWPAVDILDPSAVFAVHDRLLAWLRERLPGLRSLDEYHLPAAVSNLQLCSGQARYSRTCVPTTHPGWAVGDC